MFWWLQEARDLIINFTVTITYNSVLINPIFQLLTFVRCFSRSYCGSLDSNNSLALWKIVDDVVLINLTEFKVALKGKRIRRVIALNDLIARGYRQFLIDFMRLCRGNESLSVALMTILSMQVFHKRDYFAFTRAFAHGLFVIMKAESCRHGESRNAAGVPNIFQVTWIFVGSKLSEISRGEARLLLVNTHLFFIV